MESEIEKQGVMETENLKETHAKVSKQALELLRKKAVGDHIRPFEDEFFVSFSFSFSLFCLWWLIIPFSNRAPLRKALSAKSTAILKSQSNCAKISSKNYSRNYLNQFRQTMFLSVIFCFCFCFCFCFLFFVFFFFFFFFWFCFSFSFFPFPCFFFSSQVNNPTTEKG